MTTTRIINSAKIVPYLFIIYTPSLSPLDSTIPRFHSILPSIYVFPLFQEIEALQKDNQRLKDENSALLRVVGSLSEHRK